jgi:hypothetical protein
MVQLWEGRPLRQRLSLGQARQLTVSSGTHGELADEPSEGSSIVFWPLATPPCRRSPLERK